MILILSAATLLAINRPYDADSVANCAFYSLVLGIAIQVIITIRESRKHSHTSDSRPPDPA
jgi:hypothetical protein